MYLKLGTYSAFVMLIFFFVILGIYYWQSKQGKSYTIKRSILALEMIPQAIGRAVEMGKPLHGCTGGSSTTSWRGPHVLAGMALMEHIAKLASDANIAFWQSPVTPDQIVLAEDALRMGYARGDNPDAFKKEYVVFHGADDGSFVAGVFGLLDRIKPGANFLLGGFGGEAILLAEEGNKTGAFQIAGTPTTWQLPYFATCCEYVMMSDEIYAAGCIVSDDNDATSIIIGIDVVKVLLVVLTIIGTLATTFGITLIKDIMVM